LKSVALALILTLAGQTPTDRRVITFYGVGLVKIGVTVAAASEAAGEPFKPSPETPPGTEECGHVELSSDPHVWFMVEHGRITRLETASRLFRTASGVRVGDSEARVHSIYGPRLEVQPHKYVDDGHYLIVRSADRKFALVMETDGKEVFNLLAGLVPSVEYVEGCL
jgi:hypothetical protein